MKNCRFIIPGLIFSFMLFASANKAQKLITPMSVSRELAVSLSEISLTGDTSVFKPSWKERKIAPGIIEYVLSLKAGRQSVPPKMKLKFSFPSNDIVQYWNPGNQMDKVNYYNNNITSRASANAPVLCFMNSRNQNRMTIACSEAMNKVSINSELIEEDCRFHIEIEFFNERLPDISEYQFVLRLDTRSIHFNKSLNDLTQWWSKMDNYKPASIPDDAKKPMYSTWYSFHQNLNVQEILKELKHAQKLGMTAIIVDDGWQTMDNQRGYRYTGDWKPTRVPDMKAFVDSVHLLDMKFILWYSLPFMGEKSANYNQFNGKYLSYWQDQGTYVLDPRYPEVREFIIQTYEKAIKEWGLDGFKLDFLDWFRANDQTILTATDGRDIASVNHAVDVLMTDIMGRLKMINPNIMIEFRQSYIGPLMRKYGNMFRASDCPNMAIVNRVRTTDLRLLSGNTAVHSDMFMWHKDDPVESAALQILNILFAVPQLSVILDSLSTEQLEMTSYYLKYWNENRSILLDGEFCANDPGALYPLLRAKSVTKEIIAVYNEAVVTLNTTCNTIDIINAKGSNVIIVDFLENQGNYNVKIVDCKGEINQSFITKNKLVVRYNVPASGMIQLTKR